VRKTAQLDNVLERCASNLAGRSHMYGGAGKKALVDLAHLFFVIDRTGDARHLVPAPSPMYLKGWTPPYPNKRKRRSPRTLGIDNLFREGGRLGA
jgi:hypothetical protein